VTLVDSHCHLDDARFDEDRELVIKRAAEAGIETLLAVGTGTGPEDIDVAIRLAESHAGILATIGVHPHDARKADAATWRRMRELAVHPKVVAIGEIGLDYFYDNSPRDVQQTAFRAQLELAREVGKPVVVHTRDAWDDTFRILRDVTGNAGIIHCFSGGPEEAERLMEMGFYLGIGGVVTFPRSTELQEAVRRMPLDRLLLETDAPCLAPVPHRGQRNEPLFMIETARKVAELKETPLDEIAAVTTGNFTRLCLQR
jgi:TatD DNase family protein